MDVFEVAISILQWLLERAVEAFCEDLRARYRSHCNTRGGGGGGALGGNGNGAGAQ